MRKANLPGSGGKTSISGTRSCTITITIEVTPVAATKYSKATRVFHGSGSIGSLLQRLLLALAMIYMGQGESGRREGIGPTEETSTEDSLICVACVHFPRSVKFYLRNTRTGATDACRVSPRPSQVHADSVGSDVIGVSVCALSSLTGCRRPTGRQPAKQAASEASIATCDRKITRDLGAHERRHRVIKFRVNRQQHWIPH